MIQLYTENDESKYNYKIFKYLKPTDNTNLSALKGIDLQDLLVLLDEVYLSLRNRLDFEEKVTFGLEIEFEHTRKFRVEEQINKAFPNDYWSCAYDDSLFEGAEIISPLLRDNEKTWNDLKIICQIGKENGKIADNSGGHIHIGAQIFDANIDSFLNFIKFYSIYENVINRFFYGEFLNPRPSMTKYAKPISNELYAFFKKNRKVKRIGILLTNLPSSRYNAISFFYVQSLCRLEEGNTIEFRTPNGTLEPVIWQNNVNLCVNILKYSKNSAFNNDIVEKRRKKLNINTDNLLDFYNEIYIEQALELCDLIFDNNLDKIYFLKQYLKSFEVPTQKFQKAKRFVL